MIMFRGTIQRSAGELLALLFIVAPQGACSRLLPKPLPDPMIDAQHAYARQIEQWHQERWKELNSESGWLTLVGLFWLKEGANKFGSDAANDIVIPQLPPHAGTFRMGKNVVSIDGSQTGFMV